MKDGVSGLVRIVRGGSWYYNWMNTLVDRRSRDRASTFDDGLSVRLVRRTS